MKQIFRKQTALMLGMVLCLSSGTALGFLTSHETTVNRLSVNDSPGGITEIFGPPPSLNQGVNRYQKTVMLENKGKTDSYNRVFMDVMEDDIREITEFSADGEHWYSRKDYADHLPENWCYAGIHGDREYFYYRKILKPGEFSEPLMNYVRTTFKDEADVREYRILVYAECVQTKAADGHEFTGEDGWAKAWEEFLNPRHEEVSA